MRAVADIHRLGLFPAVFTAPLPLQAALGDGYGGPCSALMATAEALLRAWNPEVHPLTAKHQCACRKAQVGAPQRTRGMPCSVCVLGVV